MRLRIPPGRSGRLWLRHRIESATQAEDLLDHKQRELMSEIRRLRTVTERARADWEEALRSSRQKMQGVDSAGGSALVEVAASLGGAPASVEIDWRTIMGVHYPIGARAILPESTALGPLPGGAALSAARDAFRTALEAAVAVAAADAAYGRIEAELTRTTRALRALNLRAIPAYRGALAELELRLDEAEREDMIRVRWAAGDAEGGESE
jgi:V/A-type H+-transporting ATPase subunit D